MAKYTYTPMIENEMQKNDQAFIVKKYPSISLKQTFRGSDVQIAVYQGDKCYCFKDKFPSGEFTLASIAPNMKAPFFSFGKCKNVDIYFVNRKKYAAPVELRAKTLFGKLILFKGYCEFSIDQIFPRDFLKWADANGLKPQNGVYLALSAVQNHIINKTLPRYFETTLFNSKIESKYISFMLDKVEHKEIFDKIITSVSESMKGMGVSLKVDLIKN